MAVSKALADLKMDPTRMEATVFNLTRIGELAKASFGAESRVQITPIPWQQLYGMRAHIVNGCTGIYMRIVRDTTAEDIPKLNAAFNKISKRVNSQPGCLGFC